VDSTLIVLERRGPEELPDVDTALLREVVQAAFGQRRKTLVNALGAGLRLTREQTLEIVTGLGLSPDIRAERLQPGQFVQVAEAVSRRR
jgi:16S rRNA (adenine1518-N6/adenine1519-N6)-dimethyltransferase